ncbi:MULTISPECIES: hypothetical protein [Xanthomonas]|uniref:hypothetical protein n=1 Tax=Xanthomonas TaxID=338 RepID=UPI000F8E3633|nr:MULTISPECIES: hypothetical protein [Xanthomonas]
MNTVTHVAHSRPRGTNRSHWVAALALALAFALPGVVSANEGGFRHNVLMRGQVLEKQDGTLVVCVGQADGAQVGQVLDVIRHKRRIRHSRGRRSTLPPRERWPSAHRRTVRQPLRGG